MTQKKTPTPEQIQEYRRICETAVTSEDYDKVNAFTDEYDTFTYVFEESGRMGVKDAAGEVLVPALFDDVAYTFADFFRGTAVAVIRSGKMALVKPDGKGTMLTDFIYDSIHFQDGFYFMVKDGKYGLATSGGHVVVPAEQDEVFMPINHLASFTKDGRNGFAMIGTGLITDAEYEDYDLTESDYLKVYRNGLPGYIDAEGNFTEDEDEMFFNAACD